MDQKALSFMLSLMTNSFFDKAYSTAGNASMRALYDQWASQYDQDVLSNGYATPARVAAALSDALDRPGAPILDFGCGTGLSGQALSDAGFLRIDGTDLSEEMLKIARARTVYNTLWTTDSDAPLPVAKGMYAAVTAVGVISAGAAPPETYRLLLDILEPGGLLVFSLNDQSMAMTEYADPIRTSIECGDAVIRSQIYGPHLAGHGANSGSTVYVLERS